MDKPVGDPGTYDYSGIPDWFPQEAKDCIKAHEQAHAAHDMPCCDKARAAYQAPGADKAKVMADWVAHQTATEAWSECAAEKAGLACYEGKMKKLGCAKAKPPSPLAEKCCVLASQREDADAEVNDPGGPCDKTKGGTEPPCPF